MKETVKETVGAKELSERLKNFAIDYFLIDARKDKESFFAITPEELKEEPRCLNGIFVNYIMDGAFDKADELLASLEDNSFAKLAMLLVYPKTTESRFLEITEYLREHYPPIHQVVLTAGRPFLLNGVQDFTRLGFFLKKRKDIAIANLEFLYEPSIVPAIYNLCLAEYYYQQNNIIEAEVLVSRTIKEFDKASQSRLLFVALFLQSKILLTHGKIVNYESYIKNIRKFVRKEGEQEFSYNIDAAEVITALYGGNTEFVNKWLNKKAPDEFANFCMLDLYRYMVKMRCYIVSEKYAAVIALAEKLRPLLEIGNRRMDLCELDLLLAICFFRSGEKELAFEAFEHALKAARRYKYYRLIADEGEAVVHLLASYIKAKGKTPFLKMLMQMTRNMAIYHPFYLKAIYKKSVLFTATEMNVLRLLEQGKSPDEICEYLLITVNTVKFHLKKIYKKLGVNSAHNAVWQARVLGLL